MHRIFKQAALVAVLSSFAATASTQDAARVQPSSYRVVVDNDKVRVLEFTGRPGMGVCGAGLHSHPAHLTVLLTAAKVKVTENGKTTIVENKAGDSFWSPAVTHEVENYGGANVRSLIIEVKSPGKSK
jgi:mannose-6-phosphate isomerase-like protein (cupin superfamily)